MQQNKAPQRVLKPIEVCPNGHRYNSNKYGEICPECGASLDSRRFLDFTQIQG